MPKTASQWMADNPPEDVPLKDVALDEDYYVRNNQNDWQTVHRYKESRKAGDIFPPIVVVPLKSGGYAAIDGWHRTQSERMLQAETIQAHVLRGLPEKRWLWIATELNARHGRQLTTQDRVLVAAKLERQGFPIAAVAGLLSVASDYLTELVASRVVQDNGNITVLKAPLAGATGTDAEKLGANKHLASRSTRQALDEMLGLLRAKAFDLSNDSIRSKVEQVHEMCGEALGLVAV